MKLEAYDPTPFELGNQRLLNVAKALRESIKPEDFTMDCYINECGTPACAFGHYACRGDLQNEFHLVTEKSTDTDGTFSIDYFVVHKDNDGGELSFEDDEVLTHFDITYDDSFDLFGYDGCDDAETPLEAAKYIEEFVKLRRENV